MPSSGTAPASSKRPGTSSNSSWPTGARSSGRCRRGQTRATTSEEGATPGPAGLLRDPVLRAMAPGETYGLEELAAKTGIDPMALMARLTRFELGGWVLRVEGGRFVRAGANVLW